MSDPIRVLLADKQRLLHGSIRTVLSDKTKLILLGEATTVEEMHQLTQRLRPEVLLLALNLIEPPLTEIFDRLKACCPAVKILVLLPDKKAPVQHLMEAGAAGCFYKGQTAKKLVEAINVVAQGEPYLSPRLLKNLLQLPDSARPLTLTRRELDVLQLVTEGKTDREIALLLGVSERTVRYHLENTYKKLGVRTRAAAAYLAGKLNLFEK
jgi:DNA-binding NarL/FixJ family response regulator